MSDQKQNLTNAEMRQVEKLPSNIKRRVLTRFVSSIQMGLWHLL